MVVVGCCNSNSCNVWDFSLSGSRSFLEVNVSSLSWPDNSAGDLIAMVKKWPFKRLLEQQKVTLNRLVPVLLWELLPPKTNMSLFQRDHLKKEISSCQPSFFRVHVKHSKLLSPWFSSFPQVGYVNFQGVFFPFLTWTFPTILQVEDEIASRQMFADCGQCEILPLEKKNCGWFDSFRQMSI